ncbi:hypothetical protein [Halomonas sp. NO4]|uniref:hypothetical protein n=1 Tax=Halomonas sp. NO4 TaxID=2484813 RepID=UPI0013CFAE8D|nr:hypothetical protein [Halomonas sp. NO4]
MAKIALFDSQGRVINTVMGSLDQFPDGEDITGKPYGVGWVKGSDGSWTPPAQRAPTLSRVEFLKRFTRDERINIRKETNTDDVVGDFKEMLNLAVSVNLADPDVVEGMDYLVQVGLLTQDRRDKILSY